MLTSAAEFLSLFMSSSSSIQSTELKQISRHTYKEKVFPVTMCAKHFLAAANKK